MLKNDNRLFFLLNPDEDTPENDPVRVVDAVIESLDLKEFKKLYHEHGRCPYHPKMMLKINLYAYMNNIYSYRKSSVCLAHLLRECQKSGCFRSDLGADAFMDLHSIVETTKKHGNSSYNAILALFYSATTSVVSAE